MLTNANKYSKYKQMLANVSKYKQVQANARKMQTNTSKCQQMLANTSKWKQMLATPPAIMMHRQPSPLAIDAPPAITASDHRRQAQRRKRYFPKINKNLSDPIFPM